jgi:hypothetical protein
MRNLAIGGVVLVFVLIGVLYLVLRFHPSPATGPCPPASVGHGPIISNMADSDEFVNVAPNPPPLMMKPAGVDPTTHPGLCIDQGTGDIHLYHNRVARIALSLTLDPKLKLLWPADPTAAFNVSSDALYQPTVVSPDQTILTVFLQAKSNGQKYPYVATYLDHGNPFHTEPGIQNH